MENIKLDVNTDILQENPKAFGIRMYLYLKKQSQH